MHNAEVLVLAGGAGVLLGAAFFGGLWWTVRRALASRHIALWFLCSQLLRTAVILAGFYFVAGGQWDRLLVCLVGFIVARLLATRWSGLPGTLGDTLVGQVDRAP